MHGVMPVARECLKIRGAPHLGTVSTLLGEGRQWSERIAETVVW